MEKLFFRLPYFLQNLGITFFDLRNNIKRRGGKYQKFKKEHEFVRCLDQRELIEDQKTRLKQFINFIEEKSPYYKEIISKIQVNNTEDLLHFPILEKETLRKEIDSIRIESLKTGINSFTGGTTGKPLQITFTKSDFQERMAILDIFREEHAYKYGKNKIAWFSGRKILNQKDEHKKRFWKTNYLYKIRYYSTFHLSQENLYHYLQNLNKFKPEFFSGFPSSIFELARYIKNSNTNIEFVLKGIFTTSETLLPYHKELIESVFHCKVINQYASAEGAPFITECGEGNLHYNTSTGIIEVINKNGDYSDKGEILITSFTTKGTPLLRYRIGDYIKLKEGKCNCGCNYPLVDYIEGRKTDYIYSKERGRIYNSQVGDCVKAGFEGILNFQVLQSNPDFVDVKIVIDNGYSIDVEKKIETKFRERLGSKIGINFIYVNEIHKEKSGKYRLIINTLDTN